MTYIMNEFINDQILDQRTTQVTFMKQKTLAEIKSSESKESTNK